MDNTKEKQVHANHRNRMKNIFIENKFDAFTEIQKLEFLLFFAIPQKDVNPLAHALLDEFGSLSKVLSASFDDLVKIKGVGKHAALLLKTFDAVSKETPLESNATKLGSADISKEYCYKLLSKATTEEFYVICMDDTLKVLKTKKLNTGSASKVNVSIADISKTCFSVNATTVIVAHNHPSGNDQFSDDDITLTNNIMCNCLLNDIRFIDHILVTPQKAVSLANKGVVSSLENTLLKRLNLSQAMQQRISAPKQPYVLNGEDK